MFISSPVDAVGSARTKGNVAEGHAETEPHRPGARGNTPRTVAQVESYHDQRRPSRSVRAPPQVMITVQKGSDPFCTVSNGREKEWNS